VGLVQRDGVGSAEVMVLAEERKDGSRRRGRKIPALEAPQAPQALLDGIIGAKGYSELRIATIGKSLQIKAFRWKAGHGGSRPREGRGSSVALFSIELCEEILNGGVVDLHGSAAPWAAGDDRMRSEPKAVRAACRAAVKIEARSRRGAWPGARRVRLGALVISGRSDIS
jgi:hypothetical protein